MFSRVILLASRFRVSHLRWSRSGTLYHTFRRRARRSRIVSLWILASVCILRERGPLCYILWVSILPHVREQFREDITAQKVGDILTFKSTKFCRTISVCFSFS
jgi:hypothetical protein